MNEKANNDLMLPDELIISKIYLIRGEKVMLDRDLADLYGVETKYLKRQVKRNILRFPADFMFELTNDELQIWRSQFVTSNSDKRVKKTGWVITIKISNLFLVILMN
jgi:hypothetical protein